MATALLSLEQGFENPRLSRSIWYMGALMTFHADAVDTNGRFSLIEVTGGPGGEPPLHLHQNEDELCYVLEGKLKVFRGKEELVLRPGDSGFLPRKVPHTFKIMSSYVRCLMYLTPAGFEEYFRELGRPAENLAPPELVPPPDMSKLARVAGKYGVTFLPYPHHRTL